MLANTSGLRMMYGPHGYAPSTVHNSINTRYNDTDYSEQKHVRSGSSVKQDEKEQERKQVRDEDLSDEEFVKRQDARVAREWEEAWERSIAHEERGTKYSNPYDYRNEEDMPNSLRSMIEEAKTEVSIRSGATKRNQSCKTCTNTFSGKEDEDEDVRSGRMYGGHRERYDIEKYDGRRPVFPTVYSKERRNYAPRFDSRENPQCMGDSCGIRNIVKDRVPFMDPILDRDMERFWMLYKEFQDQESREKVIKDMHMEKNREAFYKFMKDRSVASNRATALSEGVGSGLGETSSGISSKTSSSGSCSTCSTSQSSSASSPLFSTNMLIGFLIIIIIILIILYASK